MRASELLLIVRAQNQASSALKRVAGDLRGLSAVSGLQRRGQSLQIARQQMQLQRQIAMNELQSITTGKRAQEMAIRRMGAEQALQRAQLTRSRINAQQMSREARVASNLATQSLQQRRAMTGATPTLRKEAGLRLTAARTMAKVLAEQQMLLARATEIADAAITKQTAKLHMLSAAEADAANRAKVLRQNIANYGDRLRLNTAQINANNKAISAARWDRVAAGGRILQHTSRIMEYAGLVLGGTLAVMAHNAAQFETSVTLAATQTRRIGQGFQATAKNSKFLQKEIRNLMTQFPATADEMSAAAYDIYSSLNVSLPGGVKLLKLFNQAAVAGQTSLEEVSAAGITVMNNFRLGVPQTAKAFQTMFAAVRFGRMTFKEFVAMMPQLSPAFAAAGFGLREMAQAAAFMTRVMPNTRMAATSLARLTEMFGRKDFIAGAQKMGVRITDIHKRLLPLPTIVDRLAKAFPSIGKALKAGRGDTELQNIFKTITALGSGKAGTTGTIQGRRAMTFLITQSKLAHQVYRQVAKDQNEFTVALSAMEKTTGVKWGVFINQLKALALAIGADVVPALLRLQGPIQDLVQWWQNLDEGTKAFVARFATYTAVFLLVGGAVAFLTGTVIRLFATFGKFLGFGAGLSATFILVGLAVAALSGDLRGLSDILDVIANFAFGSWQGFAISMGIAASMAIKLTSALRGLAATEAAVGSTGILAGLMGRGRGARRGFQIGKEIGGMRTALAGAAAGAGLLTGSLLPVVGIVAAVAGGLFLWRQHMKQAAEDARNVKQAMAIGAGPRQAFDVFQGIVGSVENVERTQIAIRTIKRTIADLRGQLRTTRGADRGMLLDQIRLQSLDLADAQGRLQAQIFKSNRQFDMYTAGLTRFVGIRDRLREMKQHLADISKPAGRGERMVGTLHDVQQLKREIAALTAEAKASAVGLPRVFASVVTGLSKIGRIPKVSPKALQDMFNISKRVGRMLTIPEMKAVIKAELDPSAVRRLPAQIRAAFRTVRAQRIKVEIQAKEAQAAAKKIKAPAIKAVIRIAGNIVGAAAAQHKKAQKILTPLHQKVVVDPPTGLAQIGASISDGIAAGMHPVTQQVVRNVTVNQFTKGLGIRSPSSVMAREVGKPMMQGIIKGILSQRGELEKTAAITAEIFGGKVLSELDEKKKVTPKILTKDLQQQLGQYRKFNNALARLARRGAPKLLIEQLAALGPEAADKIAMLSRMSAPELAKYIRLWRRTQHEIKRSMRITQEEMKAATKAFMEDMVSKVQDMYNEIRDRNVSNFGNLFEGPTNLESMVGENFQNAMAEYNSSVADFQGQIRDLNQQLVDTQIEAAQRLADAIKQRKEELQQVFGQLFGGDWMQGTDVQTRIEWGKKLGFDDLQKDLEGQVEKFKHWREALTNIAKRVPPDLATALEELGPEAVDKLDILNNATNEQLAQYVQTWMQGQAAIAAVANKTTVDTSDITARVNDILTQIDQVTQKMSQLVMPHELTGEDVINDLKAQQAQWIEYQGLLQGLIDRGIPAELLDQLAQMGPKAIPYLKALYSMTDTQLQDYTKLWVETQANITDATLKELNRKLSMWFEYGAKIGANIVAGISSQGDYLKDYFQALIISLMEQTRLPPLPTAPPGGRPPAFPIGGGNTGGNTGQQREFSSVTNNYNQTVNATNDESLATTLERATFRLANRRSE